MKKRVAVLGSTGSIGNQTLQVIRNLRDLFELIGLSGGDNLELLVKQIKEFRPKIVSIKSESNARKLKELFPDIQVEYGMEGLTLVACHDDVDIVVTALAGGIGLVPTYNAIKERKNIALANKETLVMAGNIIINEAKNNNVEILPVDSEHSAIFQCLNGNKRHQVNRIILTASGGPFRGFKKKDLSSVTPEKALKHPNWNMGKKISIDSATLMNKGLEVIEARWLFDINYDKIDVVIHPQSIIHSMVEFIDGSILAQMGETDMRVPIQYALTYPDRVFNTYHKLDLSKRDVLTFEQPDLETFPCLSLAYEAGRMGGTMTAVMNGANEEAVRMFLENKISFLEIPLVIEQVMGKHILIKNPGISDVLEAEKWAKEEAYKYKY
ncbi:MAG: 1-deoxy-D-xylulose-5-phosphate reductoisomerase [Firmicutes bacterium]|nr:1-deoxy-D-xylulose-5-phosphate reductoisomerase [Bacillota bacterium]